MNERTETHVTGKLCGEILFLIPAYALGTTDPDETALVEANLATCPEAAAALVEYQRLADEMRVNVPQIDPAPQLEERLMARLAGRNSPEVPAQMPIPVIAAPSEPVIPSRRRSARSLFALAAAALAAAVAAVLLLVATNVYWIGRVSTLTGQNMALVAQAQQQSEDIDLANLSQASWRRLWSQQDPGALALVIFRDTDAFLYTVDMPDLPPDSVYQLWLVEPDNRHISAGTFRVDERGRGTLHFNAPEAMTDFVRLGITTEPDGGSDAPTSNPVALGDV